CRRSAITPLPSSIRNAVLRIQCFHPTSFPSNPQPSQTSPAAIAQPTHKSSVAYFKGTNADQNATPYCLTPPPLCSSPERQKVWPWAGTSPPTLSTAAKRCKN